MSDTTSDRRSQLARALLEQANALHEETLRAQQLAAEAPPDDEDEPIGVSTAAVRAAKKAEGASARISARAKMLDAQDEVRRARLAAAQAKQRLSTARGSLPLQTRNAPTVAAAAQGSANARGSASADAPDAEEESLRLQRMELHRLRAETRRQQQEVAQLREREIALAGVVAALAPRAGEGKRGKSAPQPPI
jgi:hypothetical protein